MKNKVKDRIVDINYDKVDEICNLINSFDVPNELESAPHTTSWLGNNKTLANAYFAIVAICHQTTPIGERITEGYIGKNKKTGWDYLKEKYLEKATVDPNWTSPKFWQKLTPDNLSDLYNDSSTGLTLNRINERTYLLNDLGNKIISDDFLFIEDAFIQYGKSIGNEKGFFKYIDSFDAYKDPLKKKGFFFLSIAINECGWKANDPENLLSPIDYHELRGHLRIGTITLGDNSFKGKIQWGLPLTTEEDIILRKCAQTINNLISQKTSISNSKIHYLLWNIFRNCCQRDSDNCHCERCSLDCNLPDNYKRTSVYMNQCIFNSLCISAKNPIKVLDPPYVGHYY